MMATHTPGPWGFGDRPVLIAGPDGDVIARVFAKDGKLLGPEDGANARLIATAPDLLKVLEEAVGAWAEQFDGPVDVLPQPGCCDERDLNVSGADLVDWFTQWRERAKAAIAKAKGGANG